jgi:hypothetical protein
VWKSGEKISHEASVVITSSSAHAQKQQENEEGTLSSHPTSIRNSLFVMQFTVNYGRSHQQKSINSQN